MWLLILQALYFFLPAYFANMAPVFFQKVQFLAMPISEKYFGKNKTWRGLFFAVVLGTLVFALQKYVYSLGYTSLSLLDYNGFSLWLGITMSAGAIFGDLLKSYYKRKEGINPGESWLFWDQMDFVIGGIIGSSIIYVPYVDVVVVLLIASPLLHIVVNYIGFLLGMREKKF
ncbi:CDP-archaeol synthase [Candidatus Woesearchaeota archaeon]|nr:CDP-archaeol synthase [Candidatus Woesearchaeota archaeon]